MDSNPPNIPTGNADRSSGETTADFDQRVAKLRAAIQVLSAQPGLSDAQRLELAQLGELISDWRAEKDRLEIALLRAQVARLTALPCPHSKRSLWTVLTGSNDRGGKQRSWLSFKLGRFHNHSQIGACDAHAAVGKGFTPCAQAGLKDFTVRTEIEGLEFSVDPSGAWKIIAYVAAAAAGKVISSKFERRRRPKS